MLYCIHNNIGIEVKSLVHEIINRILLNNTGFCEMCCTKMGFVNLYGQHSENVS